MNTEESECNPSVTLKISVVEAMLVWQALRHFWITHRKTPIPSPKKPSSQSIQSNTGLWGNYDCPPKIQPLLRVIKDSIRTEHPEMFKQCFGYAPEFDEAIKDDKTFSLSELLHGAGENQP